MTNIGIFFPLFLRGKSPDIELFAIFPPEHLQRMIIFVIIEHLRDISVLLMLIIFLVFLALELDYSIVKSSLNFIIARSIMDFGGGTGVIDHLLQLLCFFILNASILIGLIDIMKF